MRGMKLWSAYLLLLVGEENVCVCVLAQYAEYENIFFVLPTLIFWPSPSHGWLDVKNQFPFQILFLLTNAQTIKLYRAFKLQLW